MPKLYVASFNKTKINAVKEVFKDFEIIPVKSSSGVSDQPKSDSETLLGATNRCLNLEANTFRIGLEGGVAVYDEAIFDGAMYLCNYGCLIDDKNRKYISSGAKIKLPDEIKNELLNTNLELAEVIEKYIESVSINKATSELISQTNGTMGVLTCNLVDRKDLFVHICKLLYGQYLYQINVIDKLKGE